MMGARRSHRGDLWKLLQDWEKRSSEWVLSEKHSSPSAAPVLDPDFEFCVGWRAANSLGETVPTGRTGVE